MLWHLTKAYNDFVLVNVKANLSNRLVLIHIELWSILEFEGQLFLKCVTLLTKQVIITKIYNILEKDTVEDNPFGILKLYQYRENNYQFSYLRDIFK